MDPAASVLAGSTLLGVIGTVGLSVASFFRNRKLEFTALTDKVVGGPLRPTQTTNH